MHDQVTVRPGVQFRAPEMDQQERRRSATLLARADCSLVAMRQAIDQLTAVLVHEAPAIETLAAVRKRGKQG
jgi:DsbC/DsbD-like thiol-disulfide interchange protein